MAPKKGAAKPKEVAAAEANIADEWVKSKTGTAEIKKLVAAGVLPDQATAGWRPAVGEFFPTPNTDEAVVFEDYFWRGLGFPVHPFLRNLLELWGISLCNLHPNTVLHIAIFINFCEAYLGILPHFNLFRHLFCLKKRGGPGSKVAFSAESFRALGDQSVQPTPQYCAAYCHIHQFLRSISWDFAPFQSV